MRLVLQLVALLLTGCSMFGGIQQSCMILDPDLKKGTYHGGCKDGWADGYGEVSGVSSYRGDFLAGKKHGKGVKVMPNGDRYIGNFSDDYRHGLGVYEWGDKTPWAGDRYEGEYQRDLRHGWGVIQWSNGDRYEGAWQNDVRMGPSVMELRRAQANTAVVKSLRVGAQVCAAMQPDAANRRPVQGKVENILGETVQVRIVEAEGDADLRGIVVKVGDVLSEEAMYWQPCGQN